MDTDLKTRIATATKIGLVGPLGVGKDYCAAKLGGTVIGFADPLYALGDFLLDHQPDGYCRDKTNPGVRGLLQQLGQYGRGTVNERYPLTLERLASVAVVAGLCGKDDGLNGFGVNWEDYGRNQNIWVDALLRRAERIKGRVVVTNLRFENEVEALRKAGFLILGVVCYESTLARRQEGRASASDTSDVSEELGRRVFSAYRHDDHPQEVDGYIWNDEGPAPFWGKEGVLL